MTDNIKKRFKSLLEPHKVHQKLGDLLEFLEDVIVLILLILLSYTKVYLSFHPDRAFQTDYSLSKREENRHIFDC